MSLTATLMIDDPAPLVNVYWWHAAASQKTAEPRQGSGETVAKEIPVSFIDEYADVIARYDLRGKFSVLPYPAGLGSIGRGWSGCDAADLAKWIDIARNRVVPFMDITPEILTHAQAVDLDTMTLLPENERDWASHQTEATLTPYLACSLEFLNEVGLEANGITSPWNFGFEVENDYQTAILRSMKRVNGRGQTWYFLHVNPKGTEFLSKVVRREKGDWLVSICSQSNDYFWCTMESRDVSEAYISQVADGLVTADGTGGRLVELFRAGIPIVIHSHWQSLYSNGRRTGLRALAEVGRRVDRIFGADLRWVKTSEMALAIAESRRG